MAIGHLLGDAIDAPVMILKSCIGNRSLGWDLLPPGSERFEVTKSRTRTGQKSPRCIAGYKDSPDSLGQGHRAEADRLVCRQAV